MKPTTCCLAATILNALTLTTFPRPAAAQSVAPATAPFVQPTSNPLADPPASNAAADSPAPNAPAGSSTPYEPAAYPAPVAPPTPPAPPMQYAPPPLVPGATAFNTSEDGVPPGYHVEKHVRKGWVIAGASVMGGLYLLGVAASANQDSSSPSTYLVIPLIGPWIALSQLGGYDEEACDRQVSSGKICPSKSGAQDAYTILGLGQLAGLGMLITGIVWKRTDIVPDAIVKHDITIAPLYAGTSPAGMAVAGTF